MKKKTNCAVHCFESNNNGHTDLFVLVLCTKAIYSVFFEGEFNTFVCLNAITSRM